MIVLDTNVVSELMRPQPDPQVMAWANGLDPQAIAITAMNEAEILHGIARLPSGQRQQLLRNSWEELMASLFGGQALAFSSEAAQWFDELVSRRERLARPIATADAVIAATTLAHGAQLATRNTADFEEIGLELINPWMGLQPSPHHP
ncbi:MAG: type II toxin-antitoxin system VapC family toxin [Cyanobacteriota bacterium]